MKHKESFQDMFIEFIKAHPTSSDFFNRAVHEYKKCLDWDMAGIATLCYYIDKTEKLEEYIIRHATVCTHSTNLIKTGNYD